MSALAQIVIFVTIGAALLGLALAIWALRPRRRGDTPYCANCRYNLTGLPLDERRVKCPECGASLVPRAIVRGIVWRRWRLGIISTLFSGASLLLLVSLLDGGSRWGWLYPRLPLSWLVFDIHYGEDSTASELELDRRLIAGKLSPAQQRYLIDVWISELPKQIGANGSRPFVSHVLMQSVGSSFWNLATERQLARIADSAIADLTLAVRTRVRSGSCCPYRIEAQTCLPPSFDAEFAQGGVQVNGDAAVPTRQPAVIPGGRIGYQGHLSHTERGVIVSGRGTVDVSVDVICKIYGPAPSAGRARRRLIRETRHSLHASTNVIADPTEKVVELKRSSELDAALAERVSLETIYVVEPPRSTGNILHCSVYISGLGLPIACAFDAFVVCEGLKVPLGTVARVSSWRDLSYPLAVPISQCSLDGIDILLVHNAKPAEATVDILEIWGGDLLFRDVPVLHGAPASQHATEHIAGEIVDAEAYLAGLAETPASSP